MSTLNVAFNDNTVNTEVHLGFKQTSKHEQHAATESANQNATESANQNATATSNTNKLNEDSSVSLGRQLWDMCPGFGVASYPITSDFPCISIPFQNPPRLVPSPRVARTSTSTILAVHVQVLKISTAQVPSTSARGYAYAKIEYVNISTYLLKNRTPV